MRQQLTYLRAVLEWTTGLTYKNRRLVRWDKKPKEKP